MLKSLHGPSSVITGAGGFFGSYLAELMLQQGYNVHGMFHGDTHNIEHLRNSMTFVRCDLLDSRQVDAAVKEAYPELIFHFAAQSLPGLSWHDPEATFNVNVLGTLHLLDAVRRANIRPTIVIAGSSAEYGFARLEEVPIGEDKQLEPASPYGVSKAAADLLGRAYARAYGLRVICVRPFFVIGPRKTGDACSDFARGIVAVERGRESWLRVGNLDAIRDFLDVRDAAQACLVVAQNGRPGEAYNLCSGVGLRIHVLLDTLRALAAVPINVRQDEGLLRPVDEPAIVGDNHRLRSLGWAPSTPIEKSLADTLDHWRQTEKSAPHPGSH